MAQVAFDTLKFVRKLEQAGVSAKQAEAFSEAVRESHESVDVATKRDLEDVRKEIEARFEKTDAQITEVRKDLSAEIAEVRKDLSAEIAFVRKDIGAIEKRFDRFEVKFDRLQWFLIVGVVGLLFKDVLPRLWGG